MSALIEIINPAAPYCCKECGAALADYHMQHFPRRTLVLGACDTEGCTLKHSHQAAAVVWASPTRYASLQAISKARDIRIGEFFYDSSDQAKEAAQS